MPPQCCVPLCNNKYYMEGISLHSFPRDPKVCEKWTKAIGRGGKITFSATNPTVCSAHFRSSDFFGESHKRKWRLKRGAVPSIFAWKTGVEERQPLKKTEIGSEPHDTMDCELPGSVELKQEEAPLISHTTSQNLLEDPFEAIYIKHEPIDNPDTINKDLLDSTNPVPIDMKIFNPDTNNKDLLDSTNPVPIDMKIFNPDTTNKDLLESSKHEPVNVKRFKHDTANEDLLVKTSIKVEPFDVNRFKHEPEFEETATFLSDSLVSEYIVPTVDSELIKIVDIQDIFNQKTNQLEVSGSETSTANPTIENVASMSSNITGSSNTMLQPPIVPNLHKNERETSNSKLVPKNHPNDLYLQDQREITDLDILKNGACLRCKECKRIVSDITSAKVHKCPPRSRNFKCMICNSSFLSVSDLKNHISLEHPNVHTFQNAVGKLFLLHTSSNSGQNFLISQLPEIGPQFKSSQNQSIFSQFELIKIAGIKAGAPLNACEKSVSKTPHYNNRFISKSHEELYKHFCHFHLKIDDNVTLNKTLFLPPPSHGDSFHCPHCPRVYEISDELGSHLRYCHAHCETYQCRQCQFIQNCRLEKFLGHLCIDYEFLKPGIIYQCAVCETLCNDILSLREHQNNEFGFYLKNMTIVRTQTSKGMFFRYKIKVPLNRSLHQKQRGFSCFCSDTFESEDELNRHLESHVDCVFRKCSECELDCDNMYMYYKHVEQVHKASLLDDLDFRNQKLKSFVKKNEFTCVNQDCNNKTCINNCSLQLHIRQQHTSHLGQHFIDINELKCPICSVVFLDQKLFYAHCVPYTPLVPALDCHKSLKVCEKADRFWCRICKMPQKSVENLDRHVFNDHNVKMIHCVLCKSNFLSEKQAFSHLKSCYSKTPEFNCPICGFICANFNHLANHIRDDLHKIQPCQQCKLCLNFFYGKFNLAHHMMHAKCNLCDLYFCNVKNLTDHRKVVHGC